MDGLFDVDEFSILRIKVSCSVRLKHQRSLVRGRHAIGSLTRIPKIKSNLEFSAYLMSFPFLYREVLPILSRILFAVIFYFEF